MDIKSPSHSREIAYIALSAFLKEGVFLDETGLDPFAKRLSYGTCQYLLVLDSFIKDVRPKKSKERAILYLSLYERFFMKTPSYVQGEWVQLAKKYCHPSFAKFLNYYLRNIESFPNFREEEAFPPLMRGRFENDVYLALNRAAPLFVRDRKEKKFLKVDSLSPYLDSDRYYIQNPTPFYLIEELAARIDPPKTILDLCANPGGKTIALNEFFPDAKLYVNDIKEGREMKENFDRLKINAHFTQGDALDYPENKVFDLVVIDAPCSNSGVLNKRPEARRRITLESIKTLHELQTRLVEKGKKLGKNIAYMTCSILDEENKLSKQPLFSKKILPSLDGLDGGYMELIR